MAPVLAASEPWFQRGAAPKAPAQSRSRCNFLPLWLWVHNRRGLIMCLTLVAWLGIGGIINKHFALKEYCAADGTCRNPSLAMGVYYVVQSGLCVGFGLLVEKDNAWRWFTIAQAVTGVTIVVTFLSVWIVALKKGKYGRHYKSLVFGVYLALLAAATIFQMTYNDWCFTRAFYFAFFGLSTGGLESPGTADDVEMWFLSFWMMLGIPTFGVVVGFAINSFVSFVTDIEREAMEAIQGLEISKPGVSLSSFDSAASQDEADDEEQKVGSKPIGL